MSIRRRVRAPGPLTRRAAASAFAAPGWFAVTLAAVAALTAARVAPTLIDDRAADDAFRNAVVDAAPRAPWQPVTGVHAYVAGLLDPVATGDLTAAMDDLQVYGAPTVQVRPIGYPTDPTDPVPTVRGPSGTATAVIVHRTGVVGALAGTAGGGASTDPVGVWLPRPVADAIGAGVGSTVWFSQPPSRGTVPDPLPEAMATVAGVYEVDASGVLPRRPPPDIDGGWAALAPDLPDDPLDPSAVAPMAFADLATALAVIERLVERPLVTWDLPWQGAVTIENGRTAASAIRRLDLRLGQRNDVVGGITAELGLDRVRVTSAVPDLVADADAVRAAQAPLSASLGTTGQVLGGVMVGAVVWLASRARRREVELSVQSGDRLVAVAGRALLERAAAIVLGVGVGVASAWALVALDPDAGTVSSTAWAMARRDAAVAAVVAASIVVVVAWHAAWSSPGTPTGRVHGLVDALRWEVVVGVAAVATWWELRSHPDGALGTSAIVLFPVCAALTIAAVAIRLIGLGVAVSTEGHGSHGAFGAAPRHPAVHVVRRRVAARIREAGPSLLLSTAGLSLAIFAVSLDRAGDDAIGAKIDAKAGARTVVQLGWSGELTGGRPVLPTPPAGSTVVWRVGSIDAGPRERFDLQVVDPDSYLDAVRWHASFADLDPKSLVGLIRHELPAHVLPVIASGPGIEQLPDGGVVDEGLFQFPYQVVARVTTMPGRMDANRGMLTVAAPLLFERLGDAAPIVPTGRSDDQDGSFQTFLWSERPAGDLVAQLDEIGVDLTDAGRAGTRVVGGSDQVARTPAFVAFRAVAPFFAGVGILTLLLGAAAPLVQVLRQRRTDAVDGVVMRSFGLRRRDLLVLSLAAPSATAVTAVSVGVPTAIWLVRTVVPRADPSPSDLPGFAGTTSLTASVAGGAALVGAALVAGLVSARIAHRATAEDLRDAE